MVPSGAHLSGEALPIAERVFKLDDTSPRALQAFAAIVELTSSIFEAPTDEVFGTDGFQ